MSVEVVKSKIDYVKADDGCGRTVEMIAIPSVRGLGERPILRLVARGSEGVEHVKRDFVDCRLSKEEALEFLRASLKMMEDVS